MEAQHFWESENKNISLKIFLNFSNYVILLQIFLEISNVKKSTVALLNGHNL